MRCERQTLEAEWKQAVMFSPRAHLNFTILELEYWHLGANGANKAPWPCPGGLSVSWARADFTHLRIFAVEIYMSPLPHRYLSNQTIADGTDVLLISPTQPSAMLWESFQCEVWLPPQREERKEWEKRGGEGQRTPRSNDLALLYTLETRTARF